MLKTNFTHCFLQKSTDVFVFAWNNFSVIDEGKSSEQKQEEVKKEESQQPAKQVRLKLVDIHISISSLSIM